MCQWKNCFLLFWAIIGLACRASAKEVPEGARVSIEFDKPAYFLGENVLAHFCVENVGTAFFEVTTGGDYRGAARAMRFKVTATDEQGKAVADPYPNEMNFGGLFGPTKVMPGQKFYRSVPLTRYLRFDAPGVYQIRIQHDLGWKATAERPTPVAESTLQLLLPTPEQAAQLLDDLERLTGDGSAMVGQKSPAYRDLSAMRHVVYLPPLKERALKGSAAAIDAIGHMAAPEATQSLIDLMDSENEKISQAATYAILRRLPASPKITRRPSFWREENSHLQWLSEQSWRPAFALTVRANAQRLLLSSEQAALRAAASTLQRIGEKEDLPGVLQALERRLALTTKTPRWQELDGSADKGWQLQDDCLMLVSAAHALLQRGAVLPLEKNSSAAAWAVLLKAGSVDETVRPADWSARQLQALRHPLPFVRQMVLESYRRIPQAGQKVQPLPLSPPLLALMPKLLDDADVSVRAAACDIVRENKETRLKDEVLKVLREGKSEWLLNSAYSAAVSSGGRYEAWLIWAERLDEKGLLWIAMGNLKDVIKGAGGYGANSNVDKEAGHRLKPIWQKLLKENRARLQAGQLFEIGEAALTPALFPKEFSVTVGGKQWPPASRG